MANYLVAGAAGFIGSKVAERLLSDGHRVVGIDNLSDAYDVRLKRWRLEEVGRIAADSGRWSFHAADIRDRAGLQGLFGKEGTPDAVLHLAALAGVRRSVEAPWDYCDTNVGGTLNLLQCCVEAGVGKFVLASTSSLYGEAAVLPVREDAASDRPLSPYAATKKAAELLAHSYHRLHGLDVSVFRYFTVYGPAGRPDMSPFRFARWIAEGEPVTIFGDGTQTRDFTFVDDVARGTILGLRPAGFEIYNLGADRPAPLTELIRLLEDRLGRRAELRFEPRHRADVAATWADISKVRGELGWRPSVSLREGVAALADWYLENRTWAARIEI